MTRNGQGSLRNLRSRSPRSNLGHVPGCMYLPGRNTKSVKHSPDEWLLPFNLPQGIYNDIIPHNFAQFDKMVPGVGVSQLFPYNE